MFALARYNTAIKNNNIMDRKERCRLTNQFRKRAAEANGIEFEVNECREAICPGTCQKNESELKYLEEELEKIQLEGGKINLKGVFALEVEYESERKAFKNRDKLDELLENPLINSLPPRYLDNLLD